MKPPYCVALVHYHLNGGGVTRIIEQQSQSLTELNIPHVIFCAENLLKLKLPHHLIPALQFSNNYDINDSSLILKEMKEYCLQHFSGLDTIYHFHNHSIGLNPYLEDIVYHLSRHHRTVLQIHDFIEDGRSQNLHNVRHWDHLYPLAEHIQYLTINSRDQSILHSAGCSNCKVLSNSYRPLKISPTHISSILFYPVQALRRQNIGEILLLSLFTPSQFSYAIGQTPEEYEPLVAFWQDIASQLSLPILFDVADKISPPATEGKSFATWYSAASHIVTTSIQEGFGMTFLEPLHFQKPLIGRDLPEITENIKQQGVNHPYLYTSILITPEVLCHIGVHAQEALDFGTLTEKKQAAIITLFSQQPNLKELCHVTQEGRHIPLTTFLNAFLTHAQPLEQHLIQPWTKELLKTHMADIYTELMQKDMGPTTALNHHKISDVFDNQPKFALKHTPLDIT